MISSFRILRSRLKFFRNVSIQTDRMFSTIRHIYDKKPIMNKASKFIGHLSYSYFYFSTIATAKPTISTTLPIDVGVCCMGKNTSSYPYGNDSKKLTQPKPCDCGEDSFAIAEDSEKFILAVADGVGGWNDVGIDPALFSRSLMNKVATLETCSFLQEKNNSDFNKGDLLKLLKCSFVKMVIAANKNEEKPYGSSTACLVGIYKTKEGIDGDSYQLQTVNLGDSGFLIYRIVDHVGRGDQQVPDSKNSVIDSVPKIDLFAESTPLQKDFNCPYQLTIDPTGIALRIDDCTEAAHHCKFNLPQDGAIIVLGTDGLFDNLYKADIKESLDEQLNRFYHQRDDKNNSKGLAKLMAEDLAKKAKNKSNDPNYTSPFSRECIKAGRHRHGGKPDDITVIVAIVGVAL